MPISYVTYTIDVFSNESWSRVWFNPFFDQHAYPLVHEGGGEWVWLGVGFGGEVVVRVVYVASASAPHRVQAKGSSWESSRARLRARSLKLDCAAARFANVAEGPALVSPHEQRAETGARLSVVLRQP